MVNAMAIIEDAVVAEAAAEIEISLITAGKIRMMIPT
jgi:hypothetical protein